MRTFRNRVVHLFVGAGGFLIVLASIIALYTYLDYQRIKLQQTYATPEVAFLSSGHEEFLIEWVQGEAVIIGGERLLTFNDFQIVSGHYGNKKATAWYLRTNDGWVRVPGESLTPFMVCVARRVEKDLERWFRY